MAVRSWVIQRLRRMRWFERRWIPDAEERDEHLRRTTERLTPTPRAAVYDEPREEESQQA
jgi:hypothetical protein